MPSCCAAPLWRTLLSADYSPKAVLAEIEIRQPIGQKARGFDTKGLQAAAGALQQRHPGRRNAKRLGKLPGDVLVGLAVRRCRGGPDPDAAVFNGADFASRRLRLNPDVNDEVFFAQNDRITLPLEMADQSGICRSAMIMLRANSSTVAI